MAEFDLDLSLRDLQAEVGQDNIFLLADTNTAKYCLQEVNNTLTIHSERVLVIPAGEEHKNLQMVERIWQFLIAQGATRQSVLLCLGGGVLTDMGGFAASTFKRGIRYVNIPTTLLAMVDASTGGKTGIDYAGLKNEIGLFVQPLKTIIHIPFLNTLSREDFLSGYAEMVKHALIASPLEWAEIMAFDMEQKPQDELEHLIKRSIDIKSYIVEQDPDEAGLRKTLNFGHTIGHAIEEYKLSAGEHISHGYAVMYGMLAELYLSHLHYDFPEKYISKLINFVIEYYGKIVCACSSYDKLVDLMRHDKKNQKQGEINFTLLRNIGNPRLNQCCLEQEIREALDFLFNL